MASGTQTFAGILRRRGMMTLRILVLAAITIDVRH
jgi:hypothetical protein